MIKSSKIIWFTVLHLSSIGQILWTGSKIHCALAAVIQARKHKDTNCYQIDQLWWEMYSRKCGESLTYVKSEGADIEKV